MKIKVLLEIEMELNKDHNYYKDLSALEAIKQATGGLKIDIDKLCHGARSVKVIDGEYSCLLSGKVS